MGNHKSKASLDTKGIVKSAKNRVGVKTVETLLDDWTRVAGERKAQIAFDKFAELMQHLPKQDLRALFEMYDLDHNDKVSFDEYVVTVVILMDGKLEEKLSLIFNSFDLDGDKKITREEFALAAKRFSTAQSDPAARQAFITKVFTECDENNDGSISFEEFKSFLQRDRDAFEKVCGLLAVGLNDS